MTKSIDQLFAEMATAAGLPLSPSDTQQLIRALYERGDSAGTFEALDPNVGFPGGRAYLLGDLFSFWDVAKLFGKVGISSVTHGNALLPLLSEMVDFLRRFRRVSVELSGIEFDIMLAVKTGTHSEKEIARQLGRTEQEVTDTVRLLLTREYVRGKTLLHHDATSGQIATEF